MPTLSVLTAHECERLLRRSTIGRVVLVTPHGPEIFPVNYLAQGGELVFRVAPDSQLVQHAHGAEVLFEVDHVDEERWHGWSVVARGRAQVVTEPLANAGRTARPWVDGDRHCEVRLQWDRLSGRKVGVGWDTEAGLWSRAVQA